MSESFVFSEILLFARGCVTCLPLAASSMSSASTLLLSLFSERDTCLRIDLALAIFLNLNDYWEKTLRFQSVSRWHCVYDTSIARAQARRFSHASSETLTDTHTDTPCVNREAVGRPAAKPREIFFFTFPWPLSGNSQDEPKSILLITFSFWEILSSDLL